MSEQAEPAVWAIVELMGHVRLAGRLTEEEKFGAKMGRLDIPTDDGFVTQHFSGTSVYRITYVSEEAARAVARVNSVRPVYSYELPKQLAPAEPRPVADPPPYSYPDDGYHDHDDRDGDDDDDDGSPD